MLCVALQLTKTSEYGGNSTCRASFNLAWLDLTLSGRHRMLCYPTVKSFCLNNKSQSWEDNKSAPIMKLGLSSLALTTTGVLYTYAAVTTSTSAQPNVGTGLPLTPSRCGISCVCNFKGQTCCTFWYNSRPIMVTDAPVLISAKVWMPSTVIGINQHSGWLVDPVLSSLATSESEDSAQGCHLDWPERLLDHDRVQTLSLADLGAVTLGLLWASTTICFWVREGSVFWALPPEPRF